jgi:hypothetical protein
VFVNNTNLTKSHFQTIFGVDITPDEIVENKDKLIKFFDLLIEIDQRNKRERNENIRNPNHTN